MRKNPAAVALAKLARGKRKRYSKAELKRRSERLAELRKRRWKKKDN